jgi:O-antigen/teichoic acid export membrane protein
MSDARRKRSDLLWSVLEGAGSTGLAVVSTVVVARLLGVSDYGVIMSIYTLVQVAAYFAENTFNDAIVRQKDLDDDHATTAYAASIAIGVVFAAIIAAAPGWIASFFGAAGLETAVILAGLTLILNGLCSVPMSLLRRDLRFRDLALRNVYARIASTVTVVVGLMLGWGVWAVVAQNLVGGLVYVAYLIPLMRRATRGRVTRAALLDLLPVSIFTSTNMLLAVISQRVFLVIISVLFGPLALGLYMIGLRTVDVFSTMLLNGAKQLIYRRMAMRQGDLAGMRALYLASTQLGASIALPVFAGIYVCTPQIITVFLQPQWAGAVDTIRGFCVASVITTARMFDGLVFTSLGRAQVSLSITTARLLTFLATLFVIYVTGLGSPVDALVACSMVASAISVPLVAGAVKLRTRDQFSGLLRILAAVLIMAGAVLWLQRIALADLTAVRSLAVMVPTGVIIYGVTLALFAPATFRRIWALARGR